MIKNKISFLASLSLLVMTASTVIACFASFSSLASRPIDDVNTLKSYLAYPISSWSSGITNKVEDNKILADTIGTLVATDKYNRSFGDLAFQDKEDKKLPNVGKPSDNYTTWTYKIADDSKWFDYQGNFENNIKASDMINTAKYILYPYNLSEVFSLWTTFVAGAEEIHNYFLKQDKQSNNIPYYDDKIWEQLGMKANDNTNEVSFKLTKSAPYFDTLMTYLAFAPLPKKALLKGYNYGTNYRNLSYSGAYLVDTYNSSSNISLQKNNNYRHANLTYIKKLQYTYLFNTDVSRPRILFESGDFTQFQVNPSDFSGWRKYVGSDPAEPAFGGAESTINPDPSTFSLYYNYANTNIVNGESKSTKAEAIKSSKSLQNSDIRRFLATNLDRSKFVRFFSEPLDKTKTSSFLRNVFTTRNFVYNQQKNKDYVTYVEEEYANAFLDKDYEKASAFLKDGSDSFFQNKDLNKDNHQLTNNIKNWLQKNIGQNSITFNILMNGSTVATANKKINDMIDSFNNQNSIIKIKADVSIDTNDYQKRLREANWDLLIAGWGPDFADPLTYLNAYTLKGDLEPYNGSGRLFDGLKFDAQGMAPAFDELKLNNPYWNVLKQNTETKNLYESFRTFTNLVKKTDQITSLPEIDKRYEGFAQAEFQALYETFLFLPLYVPNGSYQINVTYVVPRTTVTIGYGSSKYKHWGMKQSKYLSTRVERNKYELKYQADLEDIKKDPSAHRDDY